MALKKKALRKPKPSGTATLRLSIRLKLLWSMKDSLMVSFPYARGGLNAHGCADASKVRWRWVTSVFLSVSRAIGSAAQNARLYTGRERSSKTARQNPGRDDQRRAMIQTAWMMPGM
ncbi:hypothetical protein PsSCT_05290 [Pseudomonas sp. SCT]